jgi:hypothetical protein
VIGVSILGLGLFPPQIGQMSKEQTGLVSERRARCPFREETRFLIVRDSTSKIEARTADEALKELISDLD